MGSYVPALRAVPVGEKPPVSADAPGVIASFSGWGFVLLCCVLFGEMNQATLIQIIFLP